MSVTLVSAERGERTLSLADFITGFRKRHMGADEILVGISFPTLTENERGTFIKLGLRKAQAISVVSIAGIIALAEDGRTVAAACISLGVVTCGDRSGHGSRRLFGRQDPDRRRDCPGRQVGPEIASPIDDIRAGADYRRGMVSALTARLLRQLRDGRERDGCLDHPITLWGIRAASGRSTRPSPLAPRLSTGNQSTSPAT